MSYFDALLQEPEVVARTIAHQLGNPLFGHVDCVVGIGLSGSLVLLPIRMLTGLHVVAVRKEETTTHSRRPWESTYELEHPNNVSSTRVGRYVIVDDFASTGNTIRVVREVIGTQGTCAGIILYDDCRSPLVWPMNVPIVGLFEECSEVVNLKQAGWSLD